MASHLRIVVKPDRMHCEVCNSRVHKSELNWALVEYMLFTTVHVLLSWDLQISIFDRPSWRLQQFVTQVDYVSCFLVLVGD